MSSEVGRAEVAQARRAVGERDNSALDRACAAFYPELNKIARAPLLTLVADGPA